MLGFRAYVCGGDVTSTGGQVMQASSTLRCAGRIVALEGDVAFCPACQTTGLLYGGDPAALEAGRPLMWHYGRVACRCVPAPFVYASQADYGRVIIP